MPFVRTKRNFVYVPDLINTMGLQEAIDLSKTIKSFMEKEARSYQKVKHLYPSTYEVEKHSSKASGIPDR